MYPSVSMLISSISQTISSNSWKAVIDNQDDGTKCNNLYLRDKITASYSDIRWSEMVCVYVLCMRVCVTWQYVHAISVVWLVCCSVVVLIWWWWRMVRVRLGPRLFWELNPLRSTCARCVNRVRGSIELSSVWIMNMDMGIEWIWIWICCRSYTSALVLSSQPIYGRTRLYERGWCQSWA
jgi:hypothetical protein